MLRYAETFGLRGASQLNHRQVFPTLMIAHIKANGSATVAGDRLVRGCAWRTARSSRAGFIAMTLNNGTKA